MKKKLVLKIILIIIAALLIIGLLIFNFLSTHLFNADGTLVNGKQDLLKGILETEDTQIRENKIEFYLEHNYITQKDANNLYQNKIK